MHRTLEKIANDLLTLAAELRNGHEIEPEALTIAARRLDAQAEMITEKIAGE